MPVWERRRVIQFIQAGVYNFTISAVDGLSTLLEVFLEASSIGASRNACGADNHIHGHIPEVLIFVADLISSLLTEAAAVVPEGV